jgi:Leucine-rich repeat (LRR) protein
LKFSFLKAFFGLFSSRHQCRSSQFTSTTPDARITSITGNLDYPNLSDIETVALNNASVTFIPDLSLFTRQFPKFTRLAIDYSGLKYVERRQLAKIPQLTFLSLAFNLIESLPEDAFSDLVNLEILLVLNNQIKVLPPKLLWNLPKLKDFGADRNRIELIPRNLFKNNLELEHLWIGDNEITRIEADFTLHPQLEYLDMLMNDCISDICDQCDIGKLRELQQKINRNCTGIA